MNVKRIFKVINHLITFLLFAALLIMLLTVISMKASGGEASLFGYQVKTVLSGSMEPDIRTGSIIAVKETDSQHPFHKGDVITFKTNDGMIVTHRVMQVQKKDQTYITKGDANDAPDLEPVAQENIIGTYSGFTIPYLGYVMSFTNSKEGAALLMVLPGVCLVIYSIITIYRALRQIEQPKKEIETESK
ncbi:signal peptidase I SipW [Lentibacillus sp. L22]|uniref:signal peptidase I SipW n=1 Tax=Lentibacillus TaxID=175304 RepID=UPI0022B1152C|nr:signal peptidase I [Lentibacillus daqui]